MLTKQNSARSTARFGRGLQEIHFAASVIASCIKSKNLLQKYIVLAGKSFTSIHELVFSKIVQSSTLWLHFNALAPALPRALSSKGYEVLVERYSSRKSLHRPPFQMACLISAGECGRVSAQALAVKPGLCFPTT
jgi:hypothetical protein